MDKQITFEIKPLDSNDSGLLSSMLNSLPANYTKYFIPFSFDKKSIENILANAVLDKYWGFFIKNELVGFFMLRGFDNGYEIPSYGVLISDRFCNKGLSKLSLQYSVSWCQLAGIKRIMLKVHPENEVAKSIYENFGFTYSGIDPKNCHLIYFKDLH